MDKEQSDKTIRYNNALHTFTEQILNVLDIGYTLFDLFARWTDRHPKEEIG